MNEEIVVTADEPLDLRRLDVYPSELTTDRLQNALHDAASSSRPTARTCCSAAATRRFGPLCGRTFIDNNDAQDDAVRLAVDADDLALIHGPPGTGKTYTIARTIRALVEDGNRVLLSAFTNRAVDNALEALRDQGFTDIVRVGTESGVRDDMQKYRLETSGDPGECASRLRARRSSRRRRPPVAEARFRRRSLTWPSLTRLANSPSQGRWRRRRWPTDSCSSATTSSSRP